MKGSSGFLPMAISIVRWIPAGGALIVMFTLAGCASPLEQHWQWAQRTNAVHSYETHLQGYPQSPYATQARKRIQELKEQEETLLYRKAVLSRKPDEADRYLKAYPNGTYTAQMQEWRELFMFEEAKNKQSTSMLKKFMKQYPQGKHVSEATTLLEEFSYRDTMNSHTAKSALLFLKEYPNSRYANEVKQQYAYRSQVLVEPVTILRTQEVIENYGNGLKLRTVESNVRIKFTNRSQQSIVRPRYLCESSSVSNTGGVQLSMSSQLNATASKLVLAPGTSAFVVQNFRGVKQLSELDCQYLAPVSGADKK